MGRSIMDNILEGGNAEGPRILVYLLLDISGSMCGSPLQAVNEGVNMLSTELKNVPEAIEMAHVSIIEFGTRARVAMPLTPVMTMNPPTLKCEGNTNMSGAIKLLNEQLDRDFRPTYAGQARGDYKPLIFLLTDGNPNNLSATVKASQELHNRPKGHTIGSFVALGCGQNVSESNLKQITEAVLLMRNMSGTNIRAFFQWVTGSVVNASRRASQAAGGAGAAANTAEAPPIPEGEDGEPAFKFTF